MLLNFDLNLLVILHVLLEERKRNPNGRTTRPDPVGDLERAQAAA